MLFAAFYLLDKMWSGIDAISHDTADDMDIFYLKFAMAGMTSPIWGGIAITPYWKLHQQWGALKWVVDDINYTAAMRKKYGSLAAKFRTFTVFNYWPVHRRFAMKSSARFVITKIGSRFIPYVGWALLALDVYTVGKWAYGKTEWGNPTPGPTP